MSQIYYKTLYHIIWTTKYREPLIDSRVECFIREYLTYKIENLGGRTLEYNTTEDHVHLLVEIPPKISVSDFVNNIKGSLSHYINVQMGTKSFYWQSGYGVLTLSEKGVPYVKNYIKNQKEKHRDGELVYMLETITNESK